METLQYAGLFLLLAQTMNMWAWLSVIQSGAGLIAKAIWTLALVVLPGVGFLIWYIVGPRQARA